MYSVSKTTISMTRGDTVRIQLALTEPDGEAYVPTEGDEIRFAATPKWGTETCVRIDVPTDTLLLEIQPSDTKQLAFGDYWYDIQLTRANGDVDTFVDRAKLVVKEEVE